MGIFNLLSTSEYLAGQKHMKEEIIVAISDLKASVQALITRVNELVGPLQDANANLTATLAAEREAAAALAASEDAEDVTQNQALTDAQAATDAALADQAVVAAEIESLQGEVDAAFAQADTEAPADTPVEEAPAVPADAPVEDAVTDAPVDEAPVADQPAVEDDIETPADDAGVVTDSGLVLGANDIADENK